MTKPNVRQEKLFFACVLNCIALFVSVATQETVLVWCNIAVALFLFALVGAPK